MAHRIDLFTDHEIAIAIAVPKLIPFFTTSFLSICCSLRIVKYVRMCRLVRSALLSSCPGLGKWLESVRQGGEVDAYLTHSQRDNSPD